MMVKSSSSAFNVCAAAVLTALAPLNVAANEWRLNMTQGVTEVSKNVYDLHMLIFYICVVIGIGVFGVMFYSMFAHRKSRGAKASNFHESVKLEVAWTVVPFLILIFMAFPATSTLKQIYDTEDAELDILITGYQWKWQYEYLEKGVSFFSNMSTPMSQIRNQEHKSENYLLEVDEPLIIPTGKKVRFLVTAHDVIHSWWVPDIAVKRDAIPGYINEAWTRIDEPGVYRGQCAELCGKDHGFMPIEVHAVEPTEFYAWLDDKRAAAEKIKALANKTFTFEELYEKGESVYVSKCASCHQINGQGIPGAFPGIAGSKVATGDIQQHISVIVDGVTGTAMQSFAEQLSEVDIAAVITYQRNAFGNNTGSVVQPIDILKYKQNQGE